MAVYISGGDNPLARCLVYMYSRFPYFWTITVSSRGTGEGRQNRSHGVILNRSTHGVFTDGMACIPHDKVESGTALVRGSDGWVALTDTLGVDVAAGVGDLFADKPEFSTQRRVCARCRDD